MANFTITASSEKAKQTVSNTDTKKYPSPAEFADQKAADEHAAKYAKSLNQEDHLQAWDWVGKATPVA